MTTFNLFNLVKGYNKPRTTQAGSSPEFDDEVLKAVAAFAWIDTIVANDAAQILRDTCAEISPSREHLGHPAMRVVNQLWRLGRKFEAALVVARIWAAVTERQRTLGMPEWPQDKLIRQLPVNLRVDGWTSRDVDELVAILL